MPQGKMYRAAYGVMLTEYEDWFDAQKVKSFVQREAGLALNIDPSICFFDAVESALEDHKIYNGFPFVLERADTSQQLIGTRGYDSGEYLLFMAGFPWEATETDFTTEEDVTNQIVKTLMMFTLDGVTAEDVQNAICYFDEELS